MMVWLALVVLNAAGSAPPEWATVHRVFDVPGFVLAPASLSGGAAVSLQFDGEGSSTLGRARLDIGLPTRLELGLFAETYVGPYWAAGLTARASVRWAPMEWGRLPVNATIGLVALYSSTGSKVFVGPRAGIVGTLIDARWHWALDSSVVLRGPTPSAYNYLVSSIWLAELNAQTSFQLWEHLSAGLYVRLRRAGPSPDGGQPWTSRLYPTTDGKLEAGVFVQLALGPINLQVSFGYRRSESPEDPGYTTYWDTASLTFAVTAGGSLLPATINTPVASP